MRQPATKKRKQIIKGQAAPSRFAQWFNQHWPAFLCFVFSFLLYANTFQHSYVLDDFSVLKENRFIKQGVDGIPSILKTSYRFGAGIQGDNIYRPLSQVMFAIEWEISPKNPSLNHIVNVFFYALSCFLLFIVLRKYLVGVNTLIITLIVLLFASHPIHTEVVANIKSRDEIMSFLFAMLTLLFMHGWMTKRLGLNLLLSAFTFFLALMSKEGTITMLLIFPLAGWYFTQARPQTIVTGALILLIPAAIYVLIRYQVLSATKTIFTLSIIDNVLAGAPDQITRFATAVMLLGKYLFLLIFPYRLVSDYSYHQIELVGLFDPFFIISFLVFSAIAITVMVKFRKKDPLIFGLIFFFVTMSIYSNLFFLIGSAFGERFMFLPSLGLSLATVFLISGLTKTPVSGIERSLSELIMSHKKIVLIFTVILILFTTKTLLRASEWRDPLTLTTADVKHSPLSSRMQMQVAMVFRDQARDETDPVKRDSLTRLSLAPLYRALTIHPSNGEVQEQIGLAWYLLRDPERAQFLYELALKKNPLKADTWNNLGSIYVDKGNYPKAIELFKKAIAVDEYFADAWQNLGSVLGRTGRYSEAIPCFLKSIEVAPEKILSYKLLGLSYQNMGQMAESNRWFEKAAIMEKEQNQ